MSLDYLFKQGLDDQLKCNTIRFTLDWKPSERKFKDIKGVLWKAFGKKAAKNVKVVLVKTTNSIALICHAPYTMMTMLMMRAKRNIHVLIEEGVMSLFVGYYTVLDHRTHEQVHYISVHIFLILQYSLEATLSREKRTSTSQSKSGVNTKISNSLITCICMFQHHPLH